MESSVMEQNQKWLLRKFHTLCTKAGISDDNKMDLIASYGHVSSKDMSDEQLKDICFKIQKQINPKLADLDIWRRRVYKVVESFLIFAGKQHNPDYVKRVACAATRYDRFNDIPADRLRNVYFAFKNKYKDYESAWSEMEKILTGNEQ